MKLPSRIVLGHSGGSVWLLQVKFTLAHVPPSTRNKTVIAAVASGNGHKPSAPKFVAIADLRTCLSL